MKAADRQILSNVNPQEWRWMPINQRTWPEMTSGTVATAVEVQLPLKVVRRKIERVGFAYFAQRRQFLAPGGVERSESDEKLEGVGEEVDISYLKSLDPKEWKDQDHYAVLGLGKLRLVRRQHVVFFPCVRFYQYLMGLPQLIL